MSEIRGDIVEASIDTEASDKLYPESKMLEKRLEWFKDLKLGVLIHWGLYSQAGIVESWQLSEKDEWAREPKAWRDDIETLKLDYWNLISEFNPTSFDPNRWAELFQYAGIKYGLFSTKHHDGFNLFNTMESEFKVSGKQSPFKVDATQKVFEAFRQHDIAAGAYYSKADWYSPYYWIDDGSITGRHANYDTKEYPEIWDKYVTFVHRQIHELTHNYGKVDFLWLDAGWCGYGNENLQMDQLAEIAREDQSELIIVNRAMGGRHENYVTPERRIPNWDEIPSKAWESNIPLGNDWGYVPTDVFKPSSMIIKNLVDVVSKGGNLVIGVGPTPEGTITQEETTILTDLGDWMAIYSEGIYSTRPLIEVNKQQTDFKIVHRDNDYYLYFDVDKMPNTGPFALNQLLDKHLDKLDVTLFDLANQKEIDLNQDQNGNVLFNIPQLHPNVLGMYGLKATIN
ncbi:alpha-L-fucosidase [Fundicoccus sp. Sow4_H7]|uniref:alpha-L-fucosidase n=1 Tax=Fundicoccus sp. Sow4_H7 TaxID=3438784 RepID=UPI003F925628